MMGHLCWGEAAVVEEDTDGEVSREQRAAVVLEYDLVVTWLTTYVGCTRRTL
jgi:hypothetical protein